MIGEDDSCIPQGSSFFLSTGDGRCCSNVYTNRRIFQVLRMFRIQMCRFHPSDVRRTIRSEHCRDSFPSATWTGRIRASGVAWNGLDAYIGTPDRTARLLRQDDLSEYCFRVFRTSVGRGRDPDGARRDARVSLRSPCLSLWKDSSIDPCTAGR